MKSTPYKAQPSPHTPGAGAIRPLTTRRAWLARAGRACWGTAAALALPLAGAQPGPGPSFYDNFAGMQLQDQAGRPLHLNSLRGKVVLVNFIFTACSTVCPVQTHALRQMLQQMTPAQRERVHLVSVSLDPLSDTPQTLTAFANRYQIDHNNWSFATGRPGDIQRLAEALWLFRDGKAKGPLEEHNTSLWLVDTQGELRVRFAGNPPDIARLGREIDTLAQGSAPVQKPTPLARR